MEAGLQGFSRTPGFGKAGPWPFTPVRCIWSPCDEAGAGWGGGVSWHDRTGWSRGEPQVSLSGATQGAAGMLHPLQEDAW